MLLLGSPATRRLGSVHAGPNRNEFIPSTMFLKLCLEHMRSTDEESFGISSKPVPKGTLGILMAAAGQGNDLSDALRRFAAAAALLRPDIQVRVRKHMRGADISLGYNGKRSARSELLIETFALTIHCAFRWLTGRRLNLLQARLQSPPGVSAEVC